MVSYFVTLLALFASAQAIGLRIRPNTATLAVRSSSGSCSGAAMPFCCTRSEPFSFDSDSYYEDQCQMTTTTGLLLPRATCDPTMNLYCCTLSFVGVGLGADLPPLAMGGDTYLDCALPN